MRSAIIEHVLRILLPIRIAYLAERRDHRWALLGIGWMCNLLLGNTVYDNGVYRCGYLPCSRKAKRISLVSKPYCASFWRIRGQQCHPERLV